MTGITVQPFNFERTTKGGKPTEVKGIAPLHNFLWAMATRDASSSLQDARVRSYAPWTGATGRLAYLWQGLAQICMTAQAGVDYVKALYIGYQKSTPMMTALKASALVQQHLKGLRPSDVEEKKAELDAKRHAGDSSVGAMMATTAGFSVAHAARLIGDTTTEGVHKTLAKELIQITGGKLGAIKGLLDAIRPTDDNGILLGKDSLGQPIILTKEAFSGLSKGLFEETALDVLNVAFAEYDTIPTDDKVKSLLRKYAKNVIGYQEMPGCIKDLTDKELDVEIERLGVVNKFFTEFVESAVLGGTGAGSKVNAVLTSGKKAIEGLNPQELATHLEDQYATHLGTHKEMVKAIGIELNNLALLYDERKSIVNECVDQLRTSSLYFREPKTETQKLLLASSSRINKEKLENNKGEIETHINNILSLKERITDADKILQGFLLELGNAAREKAQEVGKYHTDILDLADSIAKKGISVKGAGLKTADDVLKLFKYSLPTQYLEKGTFNETNAGKKLINEAVALANPQLNAIEGERRLIDEKLRPFIKNIDGIIRRGGPKYFIENVTAPRAVTKLKARFETGFPPATATGAAAPAAGADDGESAAAAAVPKRPSMRERFMDGASAAASAAAASAAAAPAGAAAAAAGADLEISDEAAENAAANQSWFGGRGLVSRV